MYFGEKQSFFENLLRWKQNDEIDWATLQSCIKSTNFYVSKLLNSVTLSRFAGKKSMSGSPHRLDPYMQDSILKEIENSKWLQPHGHGQRPMAG